MDIHFRIAIIGSHRVRVAKVISILSSLQQQHTSTTSIHDEIQNIEYIPCVASFDSYENEHGETIRYLSKLEYFENGGKGMHGLSLAKFFDEMTSCQTNETNGENSSGYNKEGIRIPGIAGFAIGCGIELQEDVDKITEFIKLLSSNVTASAKIDETNLQGDKDGVMMIRFIQPNPEFTCMKEENLYYKNLDEQEKERVTELQIVGPGKMTKFVTALARDIVDALLRSTEPSTEQVETIGAAVENNNEASGGGNVAIDSSLDGEEQQVESQPPDDTLIEYDPQTTRFACKICRTILFSEKELENPPHMKSQHSFSVRKSRTGSRSKCESLFLASGLSWMGDISESIEGKITCFKCAAKLGFWKWAGCQCSCGTFIQPFL